MKTALLCIFVVVVVVAAGFALRWSTQQEARPSIQLSISGQRAVMLAESRGCFACHSTDGTGGIGPGWAGSYGTLRVLQDGSSVLVDDDYLRRSMREPAMQVVAGFENVMVPAELNDEELRLLVGLIRELGKQP